MYRKLHRRIILAKYSPLLRKFRFAKCWEKSYSWFFWNRKKSALLRARQLRYLLIIIEIPCSNPTLIHRFDYNQIKVIKLNFILKLHDSSTLLPLITELESSIQRVVLGATRLKKVIVWTSQYLKTVVTHWKLECRKWK